MPRPKTATAGARTGKTVPTTAKTTRTKPKTVKKAAVRAKISSNLPTYGSPAATPNYIDIGNVVANTERQNRLTLIIVCCLAVVIVGFWLWNMSRVIGDAASDNSLTGISTEFKNLINSINNNPAGQPTDTTTDDRSAEELKADVLEQIARNIGIDQWLDYSSDSLGISAKHPSTWYARETDDSLIISSYASATNTPAVLGQVVIRRADNLTKLAPTDWIKVTKETSTDLALTDDATSILGGDTAIYTDTSIDGKTFHQVLYTATGTSMYIIDLYAKGSVATYQLTFDQIIATLTAR